MGERNNRREQLYFLLFSMLCAPAAASDWYAGGSAGASLYGVRVSDIDDGSFTNSMGEAASSSESKIALGLRLFAGLDLSGRLAVEGGIASLGTAKVSSVSNSCCVWSAGKVTGSINYSGIDLAVIARSEFGQWSIGGRLGAFVWRDSFEVRDSAGTYRNSNTGVDPVIGVVAIRGRLRLDLSHYATDRAVTTLAVGATFRP